MTPGKWSYDTILPATLIKKNWIDERLDLIWKRREENKREEKRREVKRRVEKGG